MNTSARISAEYFSELGSTLFQQSLILLGTALLLDWLLATLLVLAAIAAQWLAMVLIMIRRPASPMRTDLLLFRYGLVPAVLIASGLARIVWDVVGTASLFETWFGSVLVPDIETLIPFLVGAGIWIVVYALLALLRPARRPGAASPHPDQLAGKPMPESAS